VDRSLCQHRRQVLHAQEAVIENDVIGQVEIARKGLERDPVLLAMELSHLGMGLPGDHVQRGRSRATIAGMAAIATSIPLPGEIKPKVANTERSVRTALGGRRPSRRDGPENRPGAPTPGSSSDGPPCGTTRTRSGDTNRASRIIRRAVSVNTGVLGTPSDGVVELRRRPCGRRAGAARWCRDAAGASWASHCHLYRFCVTSAASNRDPAEADTRGGKGQLDGVLLAVLSTAGDGSGVALRNR
jgi:hypothetical protein